MKALLDTQILLWWNSESTKIHKEGLRILNDPSVEKFVSHASIWEMAIKIRIGKLKVLPDLQTYIVKNVKNNNLSLLPIDEQSIYATQTLELHHQDPFDRLIISQALVENIPIITADPIYKSYPVRVIRG